MGLSATQPHSRRPHPTESLHDSPGTPQSRRSSAAQPQIETTALSLMTDPDNPDPAVGPVNPLVWRRVHPLTPVMRAWGGIVGILGVLVWQAVDLETLTQLPNQLAGRGWLVLGTIASLIALIGAFSVVAWQFTAYALDTAPGGSGSVYFREGIVFRKQRQARLARIQAVDVKRSLAARLLGLSQLTCEVAGGSDSAVTIGFLREDDARSLRAEILALAAQYRAAEDLPPLIGGDGTADGSANVAAASPDVPMDPAALVAEPMPEPVQPLFQVPTPRLLLAVALPMVVALVLILVVAFGSLLVALGLGANLDDVAGSGAGEIRTFGQGIAAMLLALAPIALIAVGTAFQQVNRELDFQAGLAPDGVRLKRGLLETRAQTIPPARIQAVAVSQRLMWRPFDWWRVTMTVAGYGRDANNDTRSVLLPVGTRQEVFTALWAVLPDLGTATPESLVEAGLVGAAQPGDASGFLPSPSRARPLDPLGWRRRGIAVTDNAILIRSGWLHRRLVVVPRNRTQSIEAAQGPIQRALDLVTLRPHVPPGPVAPIAKHLDTASATQLLATLTG